MLSHGEADWPKGAQFGDLLILKPKFKSPALDGPLLVLKREGDWATIWIENASRVGFIPLGVATSEPFLKVAYYSKHGKLKKLKLLLVRYFEVFFKFQSLFPYGV